jgi:hypothetical protein
MPVSSVEDSFIDAGERFSGGKHGICTGVWQSFASEVPTMKRNNRPTPKSERNTGSAWSESEVAKLCELAEGNTPTRIIGHKLGRTESSIRSKARSGGISLKPTNQSPYG